MDEMMALDEFYVQDVDFQSGFVALQSPLHMALTAAFGGFAPPAPTGAFAYCDLGCGDGSTLNVLAAASPQATFVGIDFNAHHVEVGRERAEAAGLSNITFHHASFTELDAIEFPQFDFVGMNGIYSWLHSKYVAGALDFLAKNLKDGGLFYVDHLTLPGTASIAPVWQTLRQLFPDVSDKARAGNAMDLLSEMTRKRAGYLAANQGAFRAAAQYVEGRKSRPEIEAHFSHNVLAGTWRPQYAPDMFAELAAAGLGYAGRTDLKLNDPEIAVPTLFQKMFREGDWDANQREMLIDFLRNENNRRDVFIKNREPDAAGAAAFLREQVHVLPILEKDQRPKLSTGTGRRLDLAGGEYDGIVAAFADGKTRLAEVDVDDADAALAAYKRLLACGAYVACVQAPVASGEGMAPSTKLGEQWLANAGSNWTVAYLPSPVTGGIGIPLSGVEARLCSAALAGDADPVATIAPELKELRRKFDMARQSPDQADTSEEQLKKLWENFQEKKLPLLRALGAVGGEG